MSETPISRNPDLRQLEAEGLRLRIVLGASAQHLLVEGVPAVTPDKQVVSGTLYCPLETDQHGQVIRPIGNHQCWWIGEPPCDAAGRLMNELISNPSAENKGDGISTNVGFSRKRVDKIPYKDLHEKIWTYLHLICHEAQVIDPSCDPRGAAIPAVVEAHKQIFRYPDMATTRAGIGSATEKLLAHRVGLIGLGGTGSYILDLLAKTPIGEIHIYDGDKFSLANAFRAPGAPGAADLTEPMKADWFWAIYDRMHMGIIRHPYFVTAERLHEFSGFDFVFVAIDDAHARKTILEGLVALKVPFIDVGMDIGFDPSGLLRGMCRVTYATQDNCDHLKEVVSFEKLPEDRVYRNIQIADLNMMNASMAVMKWKKSRGFYADDIQECNSLYSTASHALTKDKK